MNTTLTNALKLAASGAAIVALTVACTGDSGSSGNLRFQDKSGVSSNKVLPAAANRSIRYNITNTAFQPKDQDLADADSSDEDIFTVTNVSGSRVTIETHAPGKAELSVVTEKDKEDSIEIEVREAANTYFAIEHLNDDDRSMGVIDVKSSYAVAPEDTLELGQHRIFDADGERLSGDTGPEFEDGESGELTVSQEEIVGGAHGDEVSVTNVYGSDFAVRTVDAFEPAELIAYAHDFSLGAELDLPVMKMQTGTTFDMKEGGYLFHVQARDSDGYDYIGSEDLNMSIKVSDPDAISMSYLGDGSDKDYCIDTNDDDRCKEWGALPRAIFVITPNSDADGDKVTLEVSAGSASQNFTIEL